MSKKKSSSDSGKQQDVVVVDTEEPVELVDESGSPVPADPDADRGSGESPDAESQAADSADTESGVTDETDDPVEFEFESKSESEAASDADIDASVADEPTADAPPGDEAMPPTVSDKPPRPRRSWFGLFNFLLILALAGAAGYYWWLEQQRLETQRGELADLESRLESQLATKIDGTSVNSSLSTLKSEIDSLDGKLGELETGQQGLRESSEKLYELFGRDRADWQLAEVEYLMRVAQHKLILENDFAGAAITLQAASDRIGLTGDPGLLPVRVTISEEIAELKTRERPDLVGMTLILAQLARQARTLQPGFAPRIDESSADDGLPRVQPPEDWRDRVAKFIDSLVEVRHESAPPTAIEADIVNAGETLEDNLKLARWAVLDRDARQYAELIDQSLQLLREYYDLDNAVNHDFMTELQTLQKMQLKPDKPDITGSLRQLQRILSQRENAPEPVDEVPDDGAGVEHVDG